MLTGLIGSLIVFGFALFVHKQLYSRDLGTARRLEDSVRRDLDAPLLDSGPDPSALVAESLDTALGSEPVDMSVDVWSLYDVSEENLFLRRRIAGGRTNETPELAPPQRLDVRYVAGATEVTWYPGPANATLAAGLAGKGHGIRLAYRVYRGVGNQPAELLATVPATTSGDGPETWRDSKMPLGSAELRYEVWAVLLREDPSGEILVEAERSDMVTVRTPEHFRLMLQGGDREEAVFRLETLAGGVAGASVSVTAHPGDPIVVGEVSTGLNLESLEVSTSERRTTRERLVLTDEGSIVLDPDTRQPRTTQTQVLIPVTRLIATLINEAGESRTLEVDLP